MSLDQSFVPDAEFRYLGFSESQIALLRDQPADLRRIVYDEGLRQLMENGPGYGWSPEGGMSL